MTELEAKLNNPIWLKNTINGLIFQVPEWEYNQIYSKQVKDEKVVFVKAKDQEIEDYQKGNYWEKFNKPKTDNNAKK